MIDELTYQKECETHSCEILSDGTHYDKNGNVVSESEYEASCGEVDNPPTGMSLPIYIILGGTLLAGVIWYITRKFTKFYDIK